VAHGLPVPLLWLRGRACLLLLLLLRLHPANGGRLRCPVPCLPPLIPLHSHTTRTHTTPTHTHTHTHSQRCALPCDFDTTYCYALGMCAATLVAKGCTGMMSSVTELHRPVAEWACSGTPLTAFFNIERRHGKNKPVIKKALVELESLPFQHFAGLRHEWALRDAYRNPGPIQLAPVAAPTVELCHTLALEYQERRTGAAAAAAAAAAPATPEAAAAGYAPLLKALLASAKPTVAELNAAHFYRLRNKVTDAMHAQALGALGSSEPAYAALLTAVRANAAGQA
jgi:hypothetical protein